jgi:hypothetical protein
MKPSIRWQSRTAICGKNVLRLLPKAHTFGLTPGKVQLFCAIFYDREVKMTPSAALPPSTPV